jgi:hypothetical protein
MGQGLMNILWRDVVRVEGEIGFLERTTIRC